MAIDMRDVRVGGTAVRGTPAKTIVAPVTLAEAQRLMHDASTANETVAFLGGGTELGLGYPPVQVDVLVRTSELARVVEYAPADLVIEVEAGMTLANLQRTLAPHGQRLALDAPHPEFATLGGLVSTNGFGPLRTRFGSLRDLIVGVSLIRADGERVRGGGKVVKNVAGFDLPKLAVGSLGSLGMIATITFRLHPLPQTATALRVAGCDGARLAALVAEIGARRLEPAAFLAHRDGSRPGFDADVIFEGFETGVAEQAERFEALSADLGSRAERLDDAALPASLDENARMHGDVRLRLAVPPADLEPLARTLEPLAAGLAETRVVVYPTLGIAFVSGYAANVPPAATAILDARRAVEGLHGHLVVLDARDRALADLVDPYGTLPASFFLMQRLKERFDPARRLNRGRFLGGL